MSKLSLESEELLNKALNNKYLSEEDWKVLIDEISDIAVDKEEDFENRGRWTYPVTYYFKYKDKYYGVTYMNGLTECQEPDYIDCNIFEVHKITKTIEVWEPVQND